LLAEARPKRYQIQLDAMPRPASPSAQAKPKVTNPNPSDKPKSTPAFLGSWLPGGLIEYFCHVHAPAVGNRAPRMDRIAWAGYKLNGNPSISLGCALSARSSGSFSLHTAYIYRRWAP